MKYKRWIAALLVVALLGAGIFYFLNKNKAKSASGEVFYPIKVVRGDIASSVKGSGKVEPNSIYTIYPKAAGTVKKLYVKEGDEVKKGDILFELSNEDVDLSLRKAELALRQQRLSAESVLKDKNKKDVISNVEGYIKQIFVKTGDQVNKGTTLATIVVNPDSTIIKAPFNANQIKNMKVGQKAFVLFTDSLYTVEGRIKSIPQKGELQSSGAVYYYVEIMVDGSYYIEGQEIPVSVTVYTEKGAEYSIAQGYVSSPETYDVKAEIAGYISGVYIAENTKVKKGAKLFTISSEELDRQIESSLLSLQQAELDYQQKLKQREDLIYRSPINGKVIDLNIKEGEDLTESQVNSSNGVLTVADFSKMKISFSVDEVDVVKIKPGMKAKITFDALNNRAIEGTVEKVSNIGVTQNDVTTYEVTVVAEPVDGVKSGMNATVEITFEQKENTLILPQIALRTINGRYFVRVPADNQGNNKKNNQNNSTMKEVKVGISNGEYVEILEGLKEGDTVLITASQSGNNNTFQNRMMNQPPIMIRQGR